MTNRKTALQDMPGEIWAIKGVTNRYDGVWDDYQWSDQRGTRYIRADLTTPRLTDEELKGIEDELKSLVNLTRYNDEIDCLKTEIAISKLEGKHEAYKHALEILRRATQAVDPLSGTPDGLVS